MNLRNSLREALVLSGLAVTLAFATLPRSAQANVYATNIRLNGGTNNVSMLAGGSVSISYLLNEPASLGVTVNILSGGNSVRALSFPGGGAGALKGTNTVVWDGKDAFGSYVGGTLAVSITAASSGYTNWTQLTSDTNTESKLFYGTGIAVDRNANSPYYGRIFVGNAYSQGLPFPGDALGVLKLNADGTAAAEGITNDMGLAWSGGFYSPWKIEVSADDYVYINDFIGNGEIYRWDPLLSTNSLRHILDQSNHANNDYLSGLYIDGAGTNTQIWTSDYYAQYGILKFGVTTNGAVATNDAGTVVVGTGPATNNLGVTPLDVALDKNGRVYAIRYLAGQADPNYALPRVFRFPAYNPATNHNNPELTADWAVGGGRDDYAGAYGVAVDPGATYVAVACRGYSTGSGNFGGNLKILYATNGAEVTSLDLGANLGGTTHHDDFDCAWDGAGNVYYIDFQPELANGVWRAFSPPGTNQATTVGVPTVQVTLPSASMPFTENFESGSLQNYWSVTGTGPYRGTITTANAPHGGARQFTMDSAFSNVAARVELTLTVNLAGYTNVLLSFWAKGFKDSPNGPPPTPFISGADFDGVAISPDGSVWYEVQGLRNLSTSYGQITVNLDAALAAFGLSYNSTFRIRFNQYGQFTINNGFNSAGIGIDDISITGSQLGVLDHFNFSSVPSPQLVNAPFPVTVTAVDGANNLVPGFTGTVALSGLVSNLPPSFNLLGSPSWQVGANGPVTVGYSFTPTNDITVLALRYYSGLKVSIWTDAGVLLASQSVQSQDKVWLETPLASPLVLLANNTYRIGLYVSDTTFYYYLNTTGPFTFANGTINHEYSYPGDGFPTFTYSDGNWPFVDLRYVPGALAVPVTPSPSGNFVNGSWTGSLTITQTVAAVHLHADDRTNHLGDGNVFAVLPTNDLSVAAAVTASPLPLGNNLVYTLTVGNSGPGTATSVVLSNTLPPNAAFVSATLSQGTYSRVGQSLVWNVGSLAGTTNATATITVTPTVAGFFTNSAAVSTTGVDADLSNNSVSLTSQVVAMGFLTVTPATGMSGSGLAGGPFNFTNQVYTLSNAGPGTLTWNVIKTAPWVSRSPGIGSGSLGPGDTASVTITLNSTANTVTPGNYFETILFTNITSGFGSTTRVLNLAVATNHVPVATGLALQVPENTARTIALPGTDADNDPLSAIITFLPLYGRLFQTADGTNFGAPITIVPTNVTSALRQVIYVPPTNFFGNGLGTFFYLVNDGRTNSTTAAVTIDITATNQPPVAVADKVSALPGNTTPPFDVLTNDFDPEGDVFTLNSHTLPSLGTLTPLGGGRFTYTPNAGVVAGTDQFAYTIIDSLSRTSSATVTINIGYLAAGDWPTLGNGPQHTGYYPSSLGTNLLKPVWTNTLSGSINQVAAANGMVFLTTSPYTLAALDARGGHQLWLDSFTTSFASMSPPTYDNGRVYFQHAYQADTQLRSVDAATGTILWTAPFGNQFFSYLAPVVVGDGVWIAGGSFGGLYGFDTGTGGQRFFDTYNDLFQVWTPAYYNGLVYSWENATFRASDPVYGTVAWSAFPPSNPSVFGLMGTAPAIAGNRAILMANNYLDSIDLTNQSTSWVVTDTVRGSPSIASNIVYCIAYTSSNSQVNAYNLADGTPLGSYVATNDTGLSSQPIVTDDTVLVASSTTTYIFSLQSHQLLQTLPAGGNLTLADGTLYIAGGASVQAYTVDTPTSNDVSIALSPLPTNTLALQQFTYTITVTNPGPDAATGLTVTNFLVPNATILSAIPSQGTCANYTNSLSANLGSLAAGASATINVTLVPTTAGNLLVTVQLASTSTDASTFNNRALAGTLVLAPISITDVSLTNPKVGTTNAVFTLSLPAPSSQTITVNYATADNTATAGIDYLVQTGTLTFAPGVTSQTITVVVKGNTVAESSEDFFVNLSSPINASLANTQGRGTILNNSGLAGQIDHFEWSPIASPQYAGQPFAVTLSAKDAFNNVVSSYNGAVTLALKLGGLNFDFENATLAPWNPLNPGGNPGPYQLLQFDVAGGDTNSQALRFEPDSGGPDGVFQNVALNARVPYTVEADWALGNESGSQNGADSAQIVFGGSTIASTNMNNPVNVRINAGDTFRGHLRGTFTPATSGNYNLTVSFTRGFLQVALWSYFDNVSVTFPKSSTNYFPYNLAFTNGVWSGPITVLQPSKGVSLVPDDGSGHSGASAVFAVLTNHPPVVNSQSLLANEDTPLPVTLTATDADNDALTYTIASQPSHGSLSGSGANLTYLGNTNYFGPDQFAFRVDDGHGNSVTGQVSLVVASVPGLGVSQLALQRQGNGQLQLSLQGKPYEHYTILASQDFVHWTTLTNLIATNGILPFIDPDASQYPYRFYRAALQITWPQINSPRLVPGTGFQLTFPGDVGRPYQVLASTNLVDWTVLTNVLAITPSTFFNDPDAVNYPWRFYRARPAP